MNDLIIRDDEKLQIAVNTLQLYDQQIKDMTDESKRLKEQIRLSMVTEDLKLYENDFVKFNRILPYKKGLKRTEAQNYLIEKDLTDDFMVLDEKAVIKAFPKFVDEVEGTEYLKISYKGEK